MRSDFAESTGLGSFFPLFQKFPSPSHAWIFDFLGKSQPPQQLLLRVVSGTLSSASTNVASVIPISPPEALWGSWNWVSFPGRSAAGQNGLCREHCRPAELSRRLLEFRESSWNSLSWWGFLWLLMSTQRALARGDVQGRARPCAGQKELGFHGGSTAEMHRWTWFPSGIQIKGTGDHHHQARAVPLQLLGGKGSSDGARAGSGALHSPGS